MARIGFMLLAPLWLAGCYGYPPQRENAAQYRPGVTEQLYTLAFVSGQADPAPQDRGILAALRPAALRAGVSAVLVTDSPLAGARAASVSRVLGRSVTVDAQAGGARLGRDRALLVLFRRAIVADACTGPGQPVGRNLWTPDDNSRQRLLPAGCATATMLLEQAANRQDVLRGQPLEPGAAGPMARAADRYLRRNDEPPPREEGQPGAGETSEERPPAQAAAPAAAPGVQPFPTQAPPQEGRLPPASTAPAPR